MLITSEDIKKKYSCDVSKACAKCKKRHECNNKDAKEYRKFEYEHRKWMKLKFFCDYINGKCKLQKCSLYNKCRKKEKTNYEIWKRAFYNNKKKDLEKLMRGGM